LFATQLDELVACAHDFAFQASSEACYREPLEIGYLPITGLQAPARAII
jgi:hypothetical protein